MAAVGAAHAVTTVVVTSTGASLPNATVQGAVVTAELGLAMGDDHDAVTLVPVPTVVRRALDPEVAVARGAATDEPSSRTTRACLAIGA